jgi:hypothetical protein
MYDWEELRVSQIIVSIITDGLWHWRTDDECETVVTDDIMRHIHPIRIQAYLRSRDLYRFKRGIVDAYWVNTAPQLPAQCATKPESLSDSMKISKRVWDKWTTRRLLAKGKKGAKAITLAACPLCGDPDSQKHMFVECHNCLIKPLREKAFDLQSYCLKDLQRDEAFPRDVHWLLPREERMTKLANDYIPNGNRTPDFERLWVGIFIPDTIELILQEDAHRELTTTQYSQYCKLITEMTKVGSLVAEFMIFAIEEDQTLYQEFRDSTAPHLRANG